MFRVSNSEDKEFFANSISASEGNLTEMPSEVNYEQLCSDNENTLEERTK